MIKIQTFVLQKCPSCMYSSCTETHSRSHPSIFECALIPFLCSSIWTLPLSIHHSICIVVGSVSPAFSFQFHKFPSFMKIPVLCLTFPAWLEIVFFLGLPPPDKLCRIPQSSCFWIFLRLNILIFTFCVIGVLGNYFFEGIHEYLLFRDYLFFYCQELFKFAPLHI